MIPDDVLAWAVQGIHERVFRPFYTLDPHEGGTEPPPLPRFAIYA